MLKKHLKFIVGIPLVMFVNLYNKYTSKWVYVRISIPQLWYMIYRDMSRIQAANHLKD